MVKIAYITCVFLFLNSCKKNENSRKNHQVAINESLETVLNTRINVDFKDEELANAYNYINLKIIERLNAGGDIADSSISQKNWIFECFNSRIMVNYKGENEKIINIISNINNQQESISIVNNCGWITIPKVFNPVDSEKSLVINNIYFIAPPQKK